MKKSCNCYSLFVKLLNARGRATSRTGVSISCGVVSNVDGSVGVEGLGQEQSRVVSLNSPWLGSLRTHLSD